MHYLPPLLSFYSAFQIIDLIRRLKNALRIDRSTAPYSHRCMTAAEAQDLDNNRGNQHAFASVSHSFREIVEPPPNPLIPPRTPNFSCFSEPISEEFFFFFSRLPSSSILPNSLFSRTRWTAADAPHTWPFHFYTDKKKKVWLHELNVPYSISPQLFGLCNRTALIIIPPYKHKFIYTIQTFRHTIWR